MAMNSHSIFRLAENGVKMNSLLCGNTLCYEMSFNDFRFQLNEEQVFYLTTAIVRYVKKQEENEAKSCRKYLLWQQAGKSIQ